MIDLKKYEMLSIFDIGTVERAKNGKIYPAHSTLIQLSASRGQVELIEKASEVEGKYAVLDPFDPFRRKYAFISIKRVMPDFMRKYKTGINLQFDALQHLRVPVHNYETQMYIEERIGYLDGAIDAEESIIKGHQNLKKYMLENMFVGGRE